jgi:hypothetical protein
MNCGLSPFRLGAPRDTPISTSWHTVENYNVKYYATVRISILGKHTKDGVKHNRLLTATLLEL